MPHRGAVIIGGLVNFVVVYIAHKLGVNLV
jgi:hypothetical protein